MLCYDNNITTHTLCSFIALYIAWYSEVGYISNMSINTHSKTATHLTAMYTEKDQRCYYNNSFNDQSMLKTKTKAIIIIIIIIIPHLYSAQIQAKLESEALPQRRWGQDQGRRTLRTRPRPDDHEADCSILKRRKMKSEAGKQVSINEIKWN